VSAVTQTSTLGAPGAGTRPGAGTTDRPSMVRIWVMAARARTLPAAVAPVLVGTSLALGAGIFHPLAFVAALLGAVFIQVGTTTRTRAGARTRRTGWGRCG
jgi:hypothetical protein